MLPSLIFQALRPKRPGYPKELKTLGDHIKARRLDLGLLQREVAPRLGVNTFTLGNWEKNQCEPTVRHYPAIMNFLRYCPVQYPKTLGERIRLHRIHRGLSISAFSNALGVDPRTIAKWEQDRGSPIRKPLAYAQTIRRIRF